MIISIVSQITGFLRELALSYFYGASNISDAYLISLTIPMVIFSFIGRALTTSFVPIYANIENEKGHNKANNFTRNLISYLMIILLIIGLISFIFAPQIVKMFASGFDNSTLVKATSFSRISIFGIYSMVVVNILSSILQYKNKYVFPALTGILMNAIVILSIFISWIFDSLILLSVGTLISMVAQTLILYPIAKKNGFSYKFQLQRKDPNIRKMIYLSIPVIAGVAVNEINVLIDRTIASGISIGGISALNYANKLNGFIYGIFVFSISTVMYPMLIKRVNQNDHKGLLKIFRESIVGVMLLVLPATVGLMTLSEPIIRFLYGRGAFNKEAILLTSSALFFYSFGIIGVSLRQIISRVYYALQDTKTPMKNATIGFTINIFLNIILSRYLGIGGLALATSVSAIITTSLLFISLRKKIGPLGLKKISISFIKILLASLFMGIMAKLSYYKFTFYFPQYISLFTTIVIAFLTFFLIIYFFKIEDVNLIFDAIKKKFVKRN